MRKITPGLPSIFSYQYEIPMQINWKKPYQKILFFTRILFLYKIIAIILLAGCKDIYQLQKPNILFIAKDDLWPDLRCCGHSRMHSLYVDQMAGEGKFYTWTYCQCSVPNPSQTSLMTGIYPSRNAVRVYFTKIRKAVPEVITFPQHFKLIGYNYLRLGKYC